MEIVPGLHQIKTPMTSPALPYMLAYVFEGPDGVSLFDAGYGTPEAIEAMTAGLASLGYEPQHIRRLIISHAHPDHIGMAPWVKEQSPGVELVMLAREWQWIVERWMDNDGWTRLSDEWLVRHGVPQAEIDEAHVQGSLAPEAGRQAAPRAGAASAVAERPKAQAAASGNGSSNGANGARRSPFRPDMEPAVKLEDGEVLEFDGWVVEAVWTPGHTPGHLCIYERNHRLMFTGDHVLPHISPNVSLHADQEGTSPLSDFRASVCKVASYDVALGLPAHEYTMPDLRGRCEVLLHHHDQRLDEVRNAIGTGPTTARDISQRVKWNTGPFDDFNIFMKRSALGETLSHLRLLEDEGRVRRAGDDGHVRWAKA
jgi:glyoxylase-like metal-dependent hydrolase (beta-lactamase superfamily II)